MEFQVYSHRHAITLYENEQPYKTLWQEVKGAIESLSEDDLASRFEQKYATKHKSLSNAINDFLRERLKEKGWVSESPIFADSTFSVGDRGRFRLDFAKRVEHEDGSPGGVSVEVAFNHGEAAAWNLLKPVLASELNHVNKAIQTDAAIVITATESLRLAGGFDSAVGTYEKYVQYLRPLSTIISVPLLIVGLEAPRTFEIVHFMVGGKKRGKVRRIPDAPIDEL